MFPSIGQGTVITWLRATKFLKLYPPSHPWRAWKIIQRTPLNLGKLGAIDRELLEYCISVRTKI